MRFSSEAKVGVIGIVTIAVLIWGINYLKGRNILSSTYSIVALYYNTGGIEASAPVMMNGVKIGFVREVKLQPAENQPVYILLNIEKEYPVGADAVADLFSADLMGTKAIRILDQGGERLLENNDTINTSVTPDLLATLHAQISPVLEKVSSLAISLDTLARSINDLAGSENTGQIFEDLSRVSEALKSSLDVGGSLHNSFENLESFSSMLSGEQDEIATMVNHLSSFSQSLDSSNIEEVAGQLQHLTSQMGLLMDQVNSGKGSVGSLIYSDTLSRSLEVLIMDLDLLVKDLNENPEDYVQISLFGRPKKGE